MPWPLEGLALAAALLAPPAVSPRITDIHEIPLHSGLNPVAALSPDGRDGVIVVAAPHVEVADQMHTDLMVLVKPKTRDEEWAVARVIGFADSGREKDATADMVSDYPHTGEDQVSSIRFVRARVDGSPAVLLVRAERDFVLPIPDPSPVTVDVFRLVIEPGFGEELFERIDRRRHPGCFDNTDAALKVLLGLPLPAAFSGPAERKPCPSPAR